MIHDARFAQLFSLLVRSCNNVKDIPAASARKDRDSKRRRKRLQYVASPLHRNTNALPCRRVTASF